MKDFISWLKGLLYCGSIIRSERSISKDMDQKYTGRDYFQSHTDRGVFTKNYSWWIPCLEAFEAIKNVGKVVSVGCGSGWAEHHMRKFGIDIISTELNLNNPYGFNKTYGEIEYISAQDAVQKYRDRAVLMAWPSYNESWTDEVLDCMGIGQVLVYIGEDCGCTATDRYHEVLDKNFQHLSRVQIPQWEGIHDDMNIYVKVANNHVEKPLEDDCD